MRKTYFIIGMIVYKIVIDVHNKSDIEEDIKNDAREIKRRKMLIRA